MGSVNQSGQSSVHYWALCTTECVFMLHAWQSQLCPWCWCHLTLLEAPFFSQVARKTNLRRFLSHMNTEELHLWLGEEFCIESQFCTCILINSILYLMFTLVLLYFSPSWAKNRSRRKKKSRKKSKSKCFLALTTIWILQLYIASPKNDMWWKSCFCFMVVFILPSAASCNAPMKNIPRQCDHQ